MNDIVTTLSEAEKKFCLIYTNGPTPYVGNEVRCYQLVFNDSTHEPTGEQEIEVSLQAHEFMTREDVKDYIDKINAISIVNAASLKPRITQTLLKIMDECSTAKYEDKWGVELSPAALRSVAVNAADKLTNMYGIKEDIAHKIQLEGTDGEGITFNLIAPQPAPKPEDELIG
jgi:hypothetical protein